MAKMKILLVDDEPDYLKIIESRILHWGYDVIKAGNGKEALESVRNKNPDVIILDYMMPDMDGVAVLEEIRKLNQDVPVIMLTAYPDVRSLKGARELGISAFIPKLSIYSDIQFSLKEVLTLVEKNKNKETKK
jgi:CheY-like chemotaxis protein